MQQRATTTCRPLCPRRICVCTCLTNPSHFASLSLTIITQTPSGIAAAAWHSEHCPGLVFSHCRPYWIRRDMYWPTAHHRQWPNPALINHHVLRSSPDVSSHTTRCRPLKADSKYTFTMRLSALLSLSLGNHQVANSRPYSRRHPVPHHWRASSQLLTRNTWRRPRVLRTSDVDRYTDSKGCKHVVEFQLRAKSFEASCARATRNIIGNTDESAPPPPCMLTMH